MIAFLLLFAYAHCQFPDITSLGYNQSVLFTDCNVKLSWRPASNSSYVDLAMQAQTSTGSFAIAFTAGGWQMVGSDGFWGFVNGSGAYVYPLYLGGQDVSQVVNNTLSAAYNVSGNIQSGYTTLFFTRDVADGHNPGTILSQFTTVASTSSVQYLRQHNCYVYSTFVVNFTSSSATAGAGINQDARIAHGVIMGVTFSILLPLAITIARFGKTLGPKNAWFYAHAAIQVTVFILAGAGAILGYVLVGQSPGPQFPTAHGPLGTVIWILLWFQFFSGLLRPNAPAEKGEKKTVIRVAWEWFHVWLGRIIFLMAAAQIVLGILDLKVPYWAFALWAPFYAFWLIIAVPLEIVRILYLSKRDKA